MSQLTSKVELPPTAGGPLSYFWRAVWIAIRLAAVSVLIYQGGTFFYQGF
jgi:hypothetical protein